MGKKLLKKFILGRKIGMSQIFTDDFKAVPVTLVEAGPCFVTQLKTKEKDGYLAVQIGFEKIEKKKKLTKSKAKKPFKVLREFRANPEDFKIGQEITVSIFKEKEKVNVSAISKGKGFAGVVKRWGFHGKDATHGTKHEERAPGAIGATTPHRVLKGKKMAGRLGGERVTVKNLEIVKIDKENNILAIKGAIPGPKKGLVEIYN
jgi:large subunit ribosomal protein L3